MSFPLRKFKQVFLGDLPLLGAVAEVGPPVSGEPFPLNLWHASTAKDQGTELINELIFVLGVVVGKVLL